MGRSILVLATSLSLHLLAVKSSPLHLPLSGTDPIMYARGINFPQSAVVHPESKDILIAAMPSDLAKPSVSVGVLAGGSGAGGSVEAVQIIDNGSAVLAPVDIAVSGDTAFVVDQGNGGAIAAYNRSSEGKWKLWSQWKLGDIVPACADTGVRYGQPESIAITKTGTIYVSLAMQKMKRGLLCPLSRCCQTAGSASTAFMRLEIEGSAAKMTEVFNAGNFFLYKGDEMPFHARAIDVTADDELLIAGYGDDSGYFGHSAWRWSFQAKAGRRIAGSSIGPGGKRGDGGAATAALLNLPWGIATVDNAVYISESGNTDVRSVDAHGVISTVNGLPNSTHTHNVRKIHQTGKSNSLLLTVCGLGENEGMLLEFTATPSNQYSVVV